MVSNSGGGRFERDHAAATFWNDELIGYASWATEMKWIEDADVLE